MLASARRRQGAAAEAFALIGPLAKADRRNAVAQYELGETLAALGRTGEAISAFRRAVAARPDMAVGWRALADLLFLSGDRPAADEAYRSYAAAPIGEPLIAEAAANEQAGSAQATEAALRGHLAARPHDVRRWPCWPILSSSEAPSRRPRCSWKGCWSAVPATWRRDMAARSPTSNSTSRPQAWSLIWGGCWPPSRTISRPAAVGAALMALGDAPGAADAFEKALRARPYDPAMLTWYGEQLKYAGRREDAIAAFRRAVAVEPCHGAARFRLGDFKTYRFTAEEEAMRKPSPGESLTADQRAYFFYALARARADAERRPGRSPITRPARPCSALKSPTMRKRPRLHPPYQGSSPRLFLRRAAAAGRTPTRFSWSACPARGRRWSSRSSPAIPRSRGRRNSPTSG